MGHLLLLSNTNARLESRLSELLARHREQAAHIDWSYHEYIPWEKGRSFKAEPWEESQQVLPNGIYMAIETALLTEVNLPWFTSGLSTTFRGSFQVLQDFIHTWTAEEDQHSNLLETYLIVTRNGNPDELHHLRKRVVEQGWQPDYQTPIETMAYTSIQERATMVFYLNVAKAAQTYDPDLSQLLRRLAKDETLHYAFYRDAVKAHLELEPNFVLPLAQVMMKFRMPGAVMPDFPERERIIAKEANYSPIHYFHQVVNTLVDNWGIRSLRPTAAEAETARLQLLAYHDRLRRVAERIGRKR
ncbi:fatty acid desaturase type 2 [Kyrpidia tusciae DSM 2912]|uniref:Fatty acid desaturase type 2 n=1 Tax=Kyrpidia tusciae (strain DSM 2912 / NBRC 15312 / T2) TaxID=562970 RepID=D5WVU0_KYRT2|nr:fatty acid desaturase type 2 [Kyrpidia tusciae DSM 2912]